MIKKIILIFFAILLLLLEHYSLNKMFDKKYFRVVYNSEYIKEGVPVFTLGYRRYTEMVLVKVMKDNGYKCRTLYLNISYSGKEVYQEVEMYCENSSLLRSETEGGGVYLIKKKLEENKSIINVTPLSLSPNSESLSEFPLWVLSVVFAFLVFLSVPWSWLLVKLR